MSINDQRHAVIRLFRAGVIVKWAAIARLVATGMRSDAAEACLWAVM